MIDIGLAGALVGGVLSLLSPCSVMLLPAFFAYAFGSVRQILARTAIFYLGLVTTLVPLGVFASALGGLITTNRQTLISVVATLIIIAGLVLLLGITVPLPGRLGAASLNQPGRQVSTLATFLLGTVYAVAGACAGPILGSVLLVASLGSPLYGAALMAMYALGMCLPLVVLAVLWGRLGARAMRWLRPRTVEIGVDVSHGATHGSPSSRACSRSGGRPAAGHRRHRRAQRLARRGHQSRVETSALVSVGAVGDIWFVFVVLLAVVGVVLLANREPADDRPDGGQGSPTARTG